MFCCSSLRAPSRTLRRSQIAVRSRLRLTSPELIATRRLTAVACPARAIRDAALIVRSMTSRGMFANAGCNGESRRLSSASQRRFSVTRSQTLAIWRRWRAIKPLRCEITSWLRAMLRGRAMAAQLLARRCSCGQGSIGGLPRLSAWRRLSVEYGRLQIVSRLLASASRLLATAPRPRSTVRSCCDS